MTQEVPPVQEQWAALSDYILSAPIVALDSFNRTLAALMIDDTFEGQLKAKFEKGSAVHNGAWLTMTPDELMLEARDEILDLWIYSMMFAHNTTQLQD